MEQTKQLQFPLEMYVDDNFRENSLKGITFKQLSAEQTEEVIELNNDLGIEWL
jgi:hypothetical protein